MFEFAPGIYAASKFPVLSSQVLIECQGWRAEPSPKERASLLGMQEILKLIKSAKPNTYEQGRYIVEVGLADPRANLPFSNPSSTVHLPRRDSPCLSFLIHKARIILLYGLNKFIYRGGQN